MVFSPVAGGTYPGEEIATRTGRAVWSSAKHVSQAIRLPNMTDLGATRTWDDATRGASWPKASSAFIS